MPRPPKELAYRPPADGDPDSADPLFVAKHRKCGRCGFPFTTTPRARYFCGTCRDFANKVAPDVKEVRLANGQKWGFGSEGYSW